MLTRRFVFSGLIYLLFFAIQIMFVDQIHFSLGGFSIFLIFVLCWAALSAPEIGAVAGFAGGVLLDLDPSSAGPFGQWMLVLAIAGYGIAFLRFGDDSLRNSPLSLMILVAFGVIFSLGAYLLLSLLLGDDLGSAAQLARTILGNGLWTLAVAPFILPIVSRFHRIVFETRELL
ncbi:MAG: rod shape-determining protein MreD [Actinobacteria bacterium]|nr:rod shape-determining protein MreD [Actinomycetota bacterium]